MAGLFYRMFIKPNVTDYLEYEVEEIGPDGVAIAKVVREPQVGGFSGTARRAGGKSQTLPPKTVSWI